MARKRCLLDARLLRTRLSVRLGRQQKLIVAALVLLIWYSSSPALSSLRAVRIAAATKLHGLKLKLAECKSEVGYLCWETREVIDAGFQGDAAVMASHIASVREPPAIGPRPVQHRGVVVAAGGQQYAANAFVNIYVLQRFLNCTLPVALMYWGKSKADAINQSTLDFMKARLSNIQLTDASALPYPAHQRWLFPPHDESRFNGWKVKVFALYAAPFEEVLLLDGDSTPLRDVAALFEHPRYRQHGSMFWPDTLCRPVELMARLNLTDPWWGGRRAWQADSGQLLLDRRRHPDVLEWLLFLNTHDEFTYFYSYGDKDSFRAAFHLAGKAEAYYQVPQRISVPLYQEPGRGGRGLVIRGILQHDPEGDFLFEHRMGPGPRKYDCASDEGRPFTHVLHQPTCSYIERHPLQQPALGVPWRAFLTPRRCPYDLGCARRARAACGVEPEGEGLQAGESKVDPVVFEVPSEAHIAQVQQQADAAFRLLREHLRTDLSLCH